MEFEMNKMSNKVANSRVFLLNFFILLLFGILVSYGQTKETLVDIEPNKTGDYAENLQLSYQPADGSTAKVNPPPFIWVPAKIS